MTRPKTCCAAPPRTRRSRSTSPRWSGCARRRSTPRGCRDTESGIQSHQGLARDMERAHTPHPDLVSHSARAVSVRTVRNEGVHVLACGMPEAGRSLLERAACAPRALPPEAPHVRRQRSCIQVPPRVELGFIELGFIELSEQVEPIELAQLVELGEQVEPVELAQL